MNASAIVGGRRKTQRSSKIGSRRKVWNGPAEKTKGGLTRKDLKKNKHGRIVSVKRSARGGAMAMAGGYDSSSSDEDKKKDEE
jgi:hypothetical protein